MAGLTTETINIPSPGQWSWNDEIQGLEFICFNTANDVKEKRKKKPLQEHVNKRLEKFGRSITFHSQLVSRERLKSMGPATLACLFISSLKRAQREQVTIEHIRQVALSLLQENEAVPIPLCFLSLIKCRELDELLSALLLYLHCYFEKKSLELKPKPLMAEPSVTEKQKMAEACVKVDVAQKQLCLCYITLILGNGLSQQHHMACGRSKGSWTHRDRQLYECLYSFLCYVAWVTFERKDLKGIQEEVGRLMRSNTFNATLKAKNREGQEQSKASSKEPSPVMTERRKSGRRPGLSKIVAQRSPVMASLLPSAQEKAPHLFQRSHPREKSAAKVCNLEKLMEQLSEQLTSCSFGILGKPMNQFSRTTLMPRWTENSDDADDAVDDDEDNEADDDDDDDSDEDDGKNSAAHMQPKKTFMAHHMSIGEEKKPGSQGHANTVISHATT